MESTTPSTTEVINITSREGMATPPANDVLAGLTQKDVFILCVWISEEPPNAKLFLLCVARFFDDEAQSSSMTYAKVAQDCGFDRRTAVRMAIKVRERWLRIHRNRGHYIAGKGNANLYDGTPPPELVQKLSDLLREEAKGHHVAPNKNFEGTPRHLEGGRGDTPPPRTTISRGQCVRTKGHRAPHTLSHSKEISSPVPTAKKSEKKKDESAAGASRPSGPHMNGAGFVIDAARRLVIEPQFVDEFKRDFPDINLEARLKYFSRYFMRGPYQTFHDCPEDYFRDKLAQDKARAAAKKSAGARNNSKRRQLDAL